MALCRTSSAETLPAGVPAICVPELSTGSRRLSGRFGRRSVQGRRDGSSRYGFRCRLGYASFGGSRFPRLHILSKRSEATLSRDGFSTDLPGASRHSAECRALPIGLAQRLRPAAPSVSVGIPGPGGTVPVLMACGRDTVRTGYCAIVIFFIRFVDV